MTPCAWCQSATGELLVPRGGEYVHVSCEKARRGRRWFIGALGLGVAAGVAAPLLRLVPEGFPVYSSETGLPTGELISYDRFPAVTLEEGRKYFQLLERELGTATFTSFSPDGGSFGRGSCLTFKT